MTDLGPGQFVGTIDFVAREAAAVDVRAAEPTRYLAWPASKLRRAIKDTPELRLALQATLAVDLTKLVEATWAYQARTMPLTTTRSDGSTSFHER